MNATGKGHLRAILLLAVSACVAATIVFAAASDKDLLSEAQTNYAKHNYKRAVIVCDQILAGKPGEIVARDAQRIRAMSMCYLGDQKAYEYAKKIMLDHTRLLFDADLWLAMGYWGEQHWPRKNAFEAYKTAAELYEKAGKHTQAADAYMKVAEMLQGGDFLPEQATAQQKAAPIAPRDWQARRRQHLEEAIKIYEHIVTLKVDDVRKAKALYTGGELAAQQGEWQLAEKGIELLRRCVKEFPKTPQAPAAQYKTGETFLSFNRYVEAVKEFQLVVQDFPESQMVQSAKEQIANIKAPQVNLQIEKSFLPGEEPKIYWQIRNIKKLHLTAGSVDLVEAVKKIRGSGIGALAEMAPMAGEVAGQWSFETPDDGKHNYFQCVPSDKAQTTVPIAFPVKARGAYLVTAKGTNPDGRAAEARCLVVISEIAALAKTDADQVLIFACDSQTGVPVNDADVAATRHWDSGGCDHAAGKTNDAGLADLKMVRRNWCNWLAAVKKGDNQAICGMGQFSWSWWGYGEQYRVYGFTERPVYRPGHTVHFKQIIRAHSEGVYANLPDAKVSVAVINPKGETIYSKEHVTDEFGALEGSLRIDEKAPLGVYRINVSVGGRQLGYWNCPGNCFRVEEYKKPEFKVTVEPAKVDYRVGDEMKIKIAAVYYFGQPVAGADVDFTIRKQSYTHRYDWPRPWAWYYENVYYGGQYGRGGYGRYGDYRRPWLHPQFDELVARGTVKTDANGEAFVTVKADPIKGHEELDLKFIVQTEVTDASRRVIRGSGEVKVTHAPFFIYPKPAQNVYGPGDSVEINVKTENPSGQPVPGDFTVEAWKIQRTRKVEKDKAGNETVTFAEELLQKVYGGKVTIGPTGRGSVRFVPDMTGHFKIVVKEARPQAEKKAVEGACELWVASRTGAEAHYAYNDLQVVLDKDQYEIGQKMKLLVNTAKTGSRVLITGEADDLLFSRVVHVQKNSKLVEIDIDKSLCPNFTLTATLLRDGKLNADTKQIVVPPTHRFLKVELKLDKGDLGGADNKYQPREKTKVRVKLTDMHTGKPVAAQVVLMMVDSSIYYIQPEFREAIEKSFYGFTRHVCVATADSYRGPASLTPWQIYWARGRDKMQRIAPPGGMAAEASRDEAGFRLAEGAANAKDAAPEPRLAEAVVRKEFLDTVLWAGSVVTDADGTAVVPVTMPDQLTTFALHAIAADKDTRVGQAQSDVITTKRIIVRLESGRFFTEGDHSYVTVIAHNYYEDAQKLKVDLTAGDELKLRQAKLAGKWIDYKSGDAIDVTVPAGGEVRIDFKTTAERPGDVKLLARARGVRESDALELTKPVVPWGASKIVSRGGRLQARNDAPKGAEAAFEIVVPEKIGRGSQSLTVTLNPSIAAVAMESLPYLAAYPYGCTEQTMSRFLPTVVMRKTLQQAGVSLDDVRKLIDRQIAADPKLAAKWEMIRGRMHQNPVYSSSEVEKMIEAGVNRLADFQHGDGGWGWWKEGSSDPYMTAYVAFGLSVARDCDVKVPAGMLDRAVNFLIAKAATPKLKEGEDLWLRHIDNDNTRAYMVYVIGGIKPAALKSNDKLKDELQRLFDARDGLTDYGRALLAMALHAGGRGKDARTVIENFDNNVVVDEKLGTAHWGQMDGWWYWYDGSTETTAWVLQAMLTVSPDDKYVPMAVNWLVANRREMYWYNTKTTAMVVYSLARYAKVAGELDCDQTFEVVIDGQAGQKVRVTKENLFSFDDRIVVGADNLAPGKHGVVIRTVGKGTLYWGAHLKYFDKSDVIKAGGNKIAVKREYVRLIPEEFTNTRHVWKDGKRATEEFKDIRFRKQPLEFGAEVASGQRIEVCLTIAADNNFEYMLFEDPKPSGCEPYQLVSGASYGGGTYANMELRDTKVVFFASWLRKGDNKISYELVCEQPGTFRVIPTFGEAMYAPFVQANSDSGKLTITEKPGE